MNIPIPWPWPENFRVHAIAAVSEGLCPAGHGSLAVSASGLMFSMHRENPRPGGWCPSCWVWWRVKGDTIVASYPIRHNCPGLVML